MSPVPQPTKLRIKVIYLSTLPLSPNTPIRHIPYLSRWTTSRSEWPKRRPRLPAPPPSEYSSWPPNPRPTLTPPSRFLTPLNLILLGLFLWTTYTFLRPASPYIAPADPHATIFKVFTPRTLLPFNGENNQPVYLAVRGRVFDVSSGRSFYGPGGPYSNFAGRDASRGLACGSFDEEMLTKDLDGPLDKLADLTPDQLEALQGWEDKFSDKYLVVGKLVAVGDEKTIKRPSACGFA